jgi:chromosome segregation ATPase
LNEFKANIQELEKKIELKSQQIAEIDERLEEIKEQIDSKLGTGNDDSQSGLTKLKQTIKSIKDENQLMSMSIEIITAALWNKRYVRARDIAKAKLRKQRRNQKSKYGSKDKNHDDDEDDIDIDGM